MSDEQIQRQRTTQEDLLCEPLAEAAKSLPLHAGSTAEDVFAVWSAQELARQRHSENSLAKYRPLWLSWQAWLDARGSSWSQATAQDLAAFLSGPPPGQRTQRPALDPQRMSAYTRERYYRVLRSVYLVACKRLPALGNPTLDLDQRERPSVRGRDLLPQVLEPQVFAALQSAAQIRAAIPLKNDQQWWLVRDRAMMALLASTGVSASELCAVRGMDLVTPTRHPLELHQLPLDGTLPDVVLDIPGTKEAVQRSLPVAAEVVPIVLDWLRFREKLLIERAARSASLAERSDYLVQHGLHGPVFVARKARDDAGALPPLAPEDVYYTIRQSLAKVRATLTASIGEASTHVASGPAIIRNTVIRHWVATLGPSAAVERAGFKDGRSLRVSVPSAKKEPTAHERA